MGFPLVGGLPAAMMTAAPCLGKEEHFLVEHVPHNGHVFLKNCSLLLGTQDVVGCRCVCAHANNGPLAGALSLVRREKCLWDALSLTSYCLG